MASENMNRWAATFDPDKVQLYPLERCAVYLFQTKDVIHSGPGGNEDMHGRLPIYHVWANDKEIYCGQNMTIAYVEYRRALQDGLNDSMT
jgi:hypothetical protein